MHPSQEWVYDPEDDFHNAGDKSYVTERRTGETVAVFEGPDRIANATVAVAAPDLAMLVRRLCRKLPADDKLRKQAEDFLLRKGLNHGAGILR
jgi:hypothetical protein